MPFTFTIEKPDADSKKVFQKLKEMIEKEGGFISGDDKKGFISSDGVEGDYVVGTKSIEILIRKKPMLYPEFAVERHIRSVFHEASS